MMCARARRVDLVDHRGERRALAAAGRAGARARGRAPRPQSSSRTGGSASSSIVDTRIGMTRKIMPIVPRCWNVLQRKRPSPAHAVGEVDLAVLLELLAVAGRQDRGGNRDHVIVIEPLFLGRRRRACPRTRIIG